MKENIQMLIKWWKFTKPKKSVMFWSAISAIIFRLSVYLIAPIFAAKVITSLTAGNIKLAMLNLTYGVITSCASYAIHHIKYMMHDKLLRSTYLRFQDMISKKIFLADKVNFKNNSKDRLLNISYQDAWNTANFADTLTSNIGYLGQVSITLIFTAVLNFYVALAILIMIFANAGILSFLQLKFAEGTKKLREDVDCTYHTMSVMLDSREYVQSDKEKTRLQKEHHDVNNKMLDTFLRRQYWSSGIDNGYGSWCKLIIFAATMFLIMMVGKGSMDVEAYLIIVPYVTTLIDQSNSVLSGFRDLRDAVVSMNRLQVISNFTERDIVRFGNNSVDDVLGQIDFIDLHYKQSGSSKNMLSDVNFHVRNNETTLIYGAKDCGKRSIFGLLIRDIEQTSGNIYIDGMNIKDYSNKSYFKNVTYTTSKPYILDGTILQQFASITTNKTKIINACEKVGLHKKINSLKDKLNADVKELNVKEKFLLGLARALLTNANIVAIYEFPSVDEKDKKEIKEVINNLHGERTFIIFSGQEEIASLCDKIVTIENGSVSNIQFIDKDEEESLL